MSSLEQGEKKKDVEEQQSINQKLAFVSDPAEQYMKAEEKDNTSKTN